MPGAERNSSTVGCDRKQMPAHGIDRLAGSVIACLTPGATERKWCHRVPTYRSQRLGTRDTQTRDSSGGPGRASWAASSLCWRRFARFADD